MSEKNITAEGSYNARAVNGTVRWGKSSKGTGQIGFTMEITSEGPYKGRRLPWFGSFAEGEASRITLDAIEAAGADMDAIVANEATIQGLGEVECVIGVKHKVKQTFVDGVLVDEIDEDTGEPVIIPTVNYISKQGGAAFKNKLTDDDAGGLTDSIAAMVAARKGGKGTPTGSDGKPLF